MTCNKDLTDGELRLKPSRLFVLTSHVFFFLPESDYFDHMVVLHKPNC